MSNVTFKHVTYAPVAGTVAQQRRALQRQQAQVRANKAVTAMLEGFSGPFLDDLIDALISKTADVAAEHKDGAFANSRLGYHAGRVGGGQCAAPHSVPGQPSPNDVFARLNERNRALRRKVA